MQSRNEKWKIHFFCVRDLLRGVCNPLWGVVFLKKKKCIQQFSNRQGINEHKKILENNFKEIDFFHVFF